MNAIYTLPVTPEDGAVRLDRWFRRRFPHLTQGQVEKMIRTGQIRIDGAHAKASDRLEAGQMIRIPPFPTTEAKKAAEEEAPKSVRLSAEDEAFIKSLVLHKDDDLIILNKPHGIPTQGGPKVFMHIDALLDGLRFGSEHRPRLIHRLDRDTSGVLAIARHPDAAAKLSEAFRARTTRKIYWALVLGAPRPGQGEIRGWMKKSSNGRDTDRELMRRAAHGEKDAVFAITDYVVLSEAARKVSWVAFKPLTGRTHQLRFHATEMGNEIVGDPKYNTTREKPFGLEDKLHLHARALEIPHPNGKLFRITAPLPAHMKAAFDLIGFDEREASNAFAPFADLKDDR